jgi:zinc protease
VDSLLAAVRRTGPTDDEINRSKASLQLAFLGSLESNLGKAQRLAIGQAFHNDPNRAFAVDYAKYQAVTAADVKRVAKTYLTTGRVVLSIVPVGKKDQASKAAASTTVTQNTTTKTNSSEAK